MRGVFGCVAIAGIPARLGMEGGQARPRSRALAFKAIGVRLRERRACLGEGGSVAVSHACVERESACESEHRVPQVACPHAVAHVSPGLARDHLTGFRVSVTRRSDRTHMARVTCACRGPLRSWFFAALEGCLAAGCRRRMAPAGCCRWAPFACVCVRSSRRRPLCVCSKPAVERVSPQSVVGRVRARVRARAKNCLHACTDTHQVHASLHEPSTQTPGFPLFSAR